MSHRIEIARGNKALERHGTRSVAAAAVGLAGLGVVAEGRVDGARRTVAGRLRTATAPGQSEPAVRPGRPSPLWVPHD